MEFFGAEIATGWFLAVTALILAYLYATWPYDYFKRIGVPGPSPWPLLGNLIALWRKGYRQFQLDLHRQYGSVVGIFEGRLPSLYLKDTEMLREILVKEFDNFTNKRALVQDVFIEHALSFLRDADWKRVRSQLTPAFSSSKLKQMTAAINDCADIMVKNLLEKSKKSGVDIRQLTNAFVLDVTCRTVFGIKVDSQHNPDDPFIKHATNFSNISWFKALAAVAFPQLTRLIQKTFSVTIVSSEALKFFSKAVDEMVESRRNAEKPTVDMMYLMLKANEIEPDKADIEEDNAVGFKYDPAVKGKKGMSKSELMANSVVFFLAGSETTASALTYLLYCLATNPDVHRQATMEVDNVLGNRNEVTSDMVDKLDYLDQVIHEMLRMYPIGLRANRICSKDVEIKGVRIQKGTLVTVPIYAIHHDPDYWPDPERFDPDRFLPEAAAQRDPLTWIPFGFGPRNCIGMRMALKEAKIASAKLLQKFIFKTCEETQDTYASTMEGRYRWRHLLTLMAEMTLYLYHTSCSQSIKGERVIRGEGDNLTLTCVYPEPTEDNVSSNMYFMFQGNVIVQHVVKNETSIEMTNLNVQRGDRGVYYCVRRYQDNTTLVGQWEVEIYENPKPPEELDCVSNNYYDLNCTWCPPDGVPAGVNWTVMWSVPDGYIRHYITVTDIAVKRQACHKRFSVCNCYICGNFGGAVDYPECNPDIEKRFMRLLSVISIHLDTWQDNTNKRVARTFHIYPKSIVKPNKAMDFTAEMVKKRNIVLSWRGPKFLFHRIIPMNYSVVYKSKWPGDEKRQWFGPYKEHKKVKAELTGLVPYTNYTVDIRPIPEAGGFFGDLQRLTCQTEEDAPEYAPTVFNGSFRSTPCLGRGENETCWRRVTLYWTNIPRRYWNGIIRNCTLNVKGTSAPLHVNCPHAHSAVLTLTTEGDHVAELVMFTSVGPSPPAKWRLVNLANATNLFPLDISVEVLPGNDEKLLEFEWSSPDWPQPVTDYNIIYGKAGGAENDFQESNGDIYVNFKAFEYNGNIPFCRFQVPFSI